MLVQPIYLENSSLQGKSYSEYSTPCPKHLLSIDVFYAWDSFHHLPPPSTSYLLWLTSYKPSHLRQSNPRQASCLPLSDPHVVWDALPIYYLRHCSTDTNSDSEAFRNTSEAAEDLIITADLVCLEIFFNPAFGCPILLPCLRAFRVCLLNFPVHLGSYRAPVR
jgi:hypothetical protein